MNNNLKYFIIYYISLLLFLFLFFYYFFGWVKGGRKRSVEQEVIKSVTLDMLMF